ncbi:hypothetical protein B9479_002933 [Cryptococcus floricola]|uniref:Protein SQS1 n=1 Tax=Cryptococcus floricola TaxID=2591691 RepID=A0A5D3AYH9_9TREE|nr:hypothetical protein B9479_002933 [Cryptococcus floricola]
MSKKESFSDFLASGSGAPIGGGRGGWQGRGGGFRGGRGGGRGGMASKNAKKSFNADYSDVAFSYEKLNSERKYSKMEPSVAPFGPKDATSQQDNPHGPRHIPRLPHAPGVATPSKIRGLGFQSDSDTARPTAMKNKNKNKFKPGNSIWGGGGAPLFVKAGELFKDGEVDVITQDEDKEIHVDKLPLSDPSAPQMSDLQDEVEIDVYRQPSIVPDDIAPNVAADAELEGEDVANVTKFTESLSIHAQVGDLSIDQVDEEYTWNQKATEAAPVEPEEPLFFVDTEPADDNAFYVDTNPTDDNAGPSFTPQYDTVSAPALGTTVNADSDEEDIVFVPRTFNQPKPIALPSYGQSRQSQTQPQPEMQPAPGLSQPPTHWGPKSRIVPPTYSPPDQPASLHGDDESSAVPQSSHTAKKLGKTAKRAARKERKKEKRGARRSALDPAPRAARQDSDVEWGTPGPPSGDEMMSVDSEDDRARQRENEDILRDYMEGVKLGLRNDQEDEKEDDEIDAEALANWANKANAYAGGQGFDDDSEDEEVKPAAKKAKSQSRPVAAAPQAEAHALEASSEDEVEELAAFDSWVQQVNGQKQESDDGMDLEEGKDSHKPHVVRSETASRTLPSALSEMPSERQSPWERRQADFQNIVKDDGDDSDSLAQWANRVNKGGDIDNDDESDEDAPALATSQSERPIVRFSQPATHADDNGKDDGDDADSLAQWANRVNKGGDIDNDDESDEDAPALATSQSERPIVRFSQPATHADDNGKDDGDDADSLAQWANRVNKGGDIDNDDESDEDAPALATSQSERPIVRFSQPATHADDNGGAEEYDDISNWVNRINAGEEHDDDDDMGMSHAPVQEKEEPQEGWLGRRTAEEDKRVSEAKDEDDSSSSGTSVYDMTELEEHHRKQLFDGSNKWDDEGGDKEEEQENDDDEEDEVGEDGSEDSEDQGDDLDQTDWFVQAMEDALIGRDVDLDDHRGKSIFNPMGEDNFPDDFGLAPTKKSKKGKKLKGISMELQVQWEKDRATKAEKKRQRELERQAEVLDLSALLGASSSRKAKGKKGKKMDKKTSKKIAQASVAHLVSGSAAEIADMFSDENMSDEDDDVEFDVEGLGKYGSGRKAQNARFSMGGKRQSRPESPQFLPQQPGRKSIPVDTDWTSLDWVDDLIQNFLDDKKQEQITLPLLDKATRKKVHMLADCYGVKSISRGSGKKKSIALNKTKRSGVNVKTQVRDRLLVAAPYSGGLFYKALHSKSTAGKPKVKGKDWGAGQSAKAMEGEEVGFGADKIGNDNVGHKLLSMMGWAEGEKIGKAGGSGIDMPIVAVVKNTKRGLGG